MDSEARLRQMEQDGVLTPAQAEMLRASLGPAGGARVEEVGGSRKHRSWPIGLAAGVLVVLAGIIVIGLALSGPGDAPIQDVTRSLNEPGGYGEMNRTLSGVLAIAVILIIPLVLWVWLHNGLVSKEERVFEAWAQTESTFQRRADLVPALIDTVSRYLRHENETQLGVAGVRAQASADLSRSIETLAEAERQSAAILSEKGKGIIEEEGALADLAASQARVGQSVASLIAVAENYPSLRSSDQFLELQAQLEGTENRINVARMRFNEAVAEYNAAIRRLPGSLVAGVGGFRRKAYFESDREARYAPSLDWR